MTHPLALLATLRLRLRSLLGRHSEEAQYSEEVAFHLEMETARNVAAGMTPAAARRAAVLAFGGVERMREERRDATGTALLDDVIADSRFALRWLRRSPAFTGAVLVTLALGIGATSAIFAI